MYWLIFAWAAMALIFVGVPFSYNYYMKKRSHSPWNLKIDETYQPNISVLVPAHNEEKTIRLKLKNLYKIDYPPEKIEIILVNDASSDATLKEINEFVESNPHFKITVLDRTEQSGKSDALNYALKHSNNDIIVVSDADCFLSADALTKSLPYLADPDIGAVAGLEMLLNPKSSWVTKSELFFNNFVQPQRLGESKVHSTIFFQGGLAAYKRTCLGEFDLENDDSGTALNIVQSNKRTIIVPEARFYTMFPVEWKNKITLKIRRASQLQRLWVNCFKMLLQNRLVLPKKIAIPEIFLQILNPVIFFALILLTGWVAIEQPVFALGFFSILLFLLLVPKGRITLVESVQNYLVLLVALPSVIVRKQLKIWETAGGSRALLNEKLLQERHLI